jgi:hypothetical protein
MSVHVSFRLLLWDIEEESNRKVKKKELPSLLKESQEVSLVLVTYAYNPSNLGG